MKVQTLPCPACGKTSEIEVDEISYNSWKNGMFVQDAFPEKSPAERELLMTGFHEECWAETFPPDEPGEDECLELNQEVEMFLDDPITVYYGVGSEMVDLVVKAHYRKHEGCPAHVRQ